MADEPSLWDLQRTIERNHAENREDILDLKAQMVRASEQNDDRFRLYLLREVFDARESSMLQRIGSLEEAARTARGQVRTAILAATGSIVASVLGSIIMSVILKGGKP